MTWSSVVVANNATFARPYPSQPDHATIAVMPVPCPCCGFKTIETRGNFELCPVCYWEDDGQDDADADVVRGGPNGELSLTEARSNFKRHAASEPAYIPNVRAPLPSEL